MPLLPAIDVPEPHYSRLVAALPGTTNAQKTTNYTNLVLNSLIAYVEVTEMGAMEKAQESARVAEEQRIRASLPARLPFPTP